MLNCDYQEKMSVISRFKSTKFAAAEVKQPDTSDLEVWSFVTTEVDEECVIIYDITEDMEGFVFSGSLVITPK